MRFYCIKAGQETSLKIIVKYQFQFYLKEYFCTLMKRCVARAVTCPYHRQKLAEIYLWILVLVSRQLRTASWYYVT